VPDADPQRDALAVYGRLSPGEPNHWVVSRIRGDWVRGTVQGYQFEITWGPAEGYDGFIPDADGAAVQVHVLFAESDELDRHWRAADEFQGQGYERQTIDVQLDDGSQCQATMYVALTEV